MSPNDDLGPFYTDAEGNRLPPRLQQRNGSQTAKVAKTIFNQDGSVTYYG